MAHWRTRNPTASQFNIQLTAWALAFSALAGAPAFAQPKSFPAVNVWEDEAAMHVEAELPGYSMDDIEVSVFGSELMIKSGPKAAACGCETGANGPSEAATTNPQPQFIRRERFCGQFERTIGLPVEIDGERVGASLQHGVLKVTLPKAKAAMPRKVTVKG